MRGKNKQTNEEEMKRKGRQKEIKGRRKRDRWTDIGRQVYR
jgi:hypothetical protein